MVVAIDSVVFVNDSLVSRAMAIKGCKVKASLPATASVSQDFSRSDFPRCLKQPRVLFSSVLSTTNESFHSEVGTRSSSTFS